MKKYILIIVSLLLCSYIVYFSYFKYKWEQWAYIFHQQWNALYKLSQLEAELEIKYLEESLEMYAQALDLWEYENTRYNYDYVFQILEAKKEEQKNKQAEEDNQESLDNMQDKEEKWNMQWEEEVEDNSNQEESQNSNNFQKERGEGYSLDSSQEIPDLTENEEKLLDETIDRLKQGQVYNQKYYNKKPQENNFKSAFNTFFWTLDRGGEQNW